jgi:uncharacterized membrane protein
VRLRLITAACALAALGIALFLTWERARGGSVPCPVGGGCETVAASPYAHLLGVPVSVFGIAGTALMLGSLALPGERGVQARLSIAFVGTAFSAYLTYLEAARIHAYCAWCVTSATLWCVILAASLAEAVRTAAEPQRG